MFRESTDPVPSLSSLASFWEQANSESYLRHCIGLFPPLGYHLDKQTSALKIQKWADPGEIEVHCGSTESAVLDHTTSPGVLLNLLAKHAREHTPSEPWDLVNEKKALPSCAPIQPGRGCSHDGPQVLRAHSLPGTMLRHLDK